MFRIFFTLYVGALIFNVFICFADVNLIHCGVNELPEHLAIDSIENYHYSPFRIIGGTRAKLNEFPWIVSIQILWPEKNITYFKHGCGGVIINEYYILTAAHCVMVIPQLKNDTDFRMSIVMGTENLRSHYRIRYFVALKNGLPDIQMHENFTVKGLDNDIALIRVSKPIDFIITKNNQFVVNSICLPTYDFEPNGETLATGWASITPNNTRIVYPNELQKIKLWVIPRQRCRSIWKKLNIDTITECMICAHSNREKGICLGDSGGPIIQFIKNRAQILGLASFVYKYCDYKKHSFPAGFTKVSKFIAWIEQLLDSV